MPRRFRRKLLFVSGATPVALGLIFATVPSRVGAVEPASVMAEPRIVTECRNVRFIVIDPKTHKAISGAGVQLEDSSQRHFSCALSVLGFRSASSIAFNIESWMPALPGEAVKSIEVPLGATVVLKPTQTPSSAGPPVRDIYVKVTAKRLVKPRDTGGGTQLTGADLTKRLGVSNSGASNPIKASTTTGAAEDSNGQAHVRGEHAEISYVIDGVPLPDTLSGRQGALIVPATIQSLDIITGGFAPEFGGQTAAVLNVNTLPDVAKEHTDYSMSYGSFGTVVGNLTSIGPIGQRASYVLNFAASRTNLAEDPQQPNNQTAHNQGSTIDMFGKLHYKPSKNDGLTLMLSRSPNTQQVNNRTGLPASYTSAGQGFGFLGLRNADGTVPAGDQNNPGGLGSATDVLGSQQADGMDITQREVNEFASLLWKHDFTKRDTGSFAVTVLHSGQDVHNNNPAVNLMDLPVDNSIEYNPTATRNIHDVQMNGSYTSIRGKHQFKTGILVNDENGTETYQIIPASQLALDELANLAPRLAPTGAVSVDANGQPILDVYGNPVFNPNSGSSPTITVHRAGFYRAAFAQDSWSISKRASLNYGLRFDWFKQSQNFGSTVDTSALEPRINFAYSLDKLSVLRLSYNRLFNTPPVAQGASVGTPIQPEVLDQYDASVEREISKGQKLKAAYYVKQMRNQVDTGLLIPGSEIGLFSAVNFQFGAVHGIEVAYNLNQLIVDPKTNKRYGWDAFLNYTYSIAAPNGLDNTGQPVPNFNDHDQRNTVSAGTTYTWRHGASAGLIINHNSGLASSPIPPSSLRVPRTQVDLAFSSGPRLFRGRASLGLEIQNVFDDRSVVNFDSGFSGTRFTEARRFMLTISGGL